MICFPNAKINLGLNIVSRRPDGYHNLETIFVPIGLRDILEAVPARETALHPSGIALEGSDDDNLVLKAFRLLQAEKDVLPMALYLHKLIPFGAGLGGGSADAAFLLALVNQMQQLGLSDDELEAYASRLGADCPFFIRNRAAFAQGIGNEFEDIPLPVGGMHLFLAIPPVAVSTREAYAGITPKKPAVSLREAVKRPVDEWKDLIVNDFEESIFPRHPEIAAIKQRLYDLGARYASMSGSGSAVYGLFDRPADLKQHFPACFCWSGPLE